MRAPARGHLSASTPTQGGGRAFGNPARGSARYVREPPQPVRPALLQLMFMLPPALGLLAPGRHQPSREGCVLEIEPGGLVFVSGPSRGEIFEHVRRFLRVVAKNKPECAMAAVLRSPPGHWGSTHGGVDSWTIVINAEIAFAPTGLGVELAPVAPTPHGAGNNA